MGLDVRQPRLSWWIESDVRDARQAAFQVQIGTAPGTVDLWDSGRVESDQSTQVEYAGAALRSGLIAHWTVRVWMADGSVAVSDSAKWEMGLLDPADWTADWIQSTIAGGPRTTAPSPHIRHEFQVGKDVASARLYITALGVYEAELNGARVGDAELAPGWTDFAKRVRYQTYDVQPLLTPGTNCLGVLLGDGWYCGHLEWRDRQRYGDRPKLLAQLHLQYADGSHEVVTTNESWKFETGHIQESDIMMGEAQDLRRVLQGWSQPGYDDSKWRSVETVEVQTTLVAQREPLVKVIEEIPARIAEVRKNWARTDHIFDFGQNLVGRVRVRLTGAAGTTVRFRFAERLNPDGTMYTANYRAARSTDYFTLTGGEDVLEPKFTFHGFQYLEVSGLESVLAENVTAVVMHSAWEPAGNFDCSEPLLNQLQHNIQWGWKGNSLDVPTDCPQRDERLGWTGDAQVFVRTACFNADVATFFAKYQQDLTDSQSDLGQIPPVAPNTQVVGADGGPAWSDAFVICPWTIYRAYGDLRILSDHYEPMKRWVDSLQISSKDLIRSYEGYAGFLGFGDWLNTNAETPIDLIGTAFYAYSARLLAKMATVLGHKADAAEYGELSEKVATAFRRRYITPNGLVTPGSQTAYVLALHFDLLPEEQREAATVALVNDIGRRGWHLSTGFVGTPYLNHVLTAGGRLDVAYRLLNQTSWPSWLYSVTQGATTIWERWDGWTHDKGFQDPGMNSFNHYAYGAIGDWMYAVVAGIELDPEVTGYKRFRLEARPGGGLTQASASFRSPYGLIASGWTIVGDRFVWEFTIPTNTSATVTAPPEATKLALDGKAIDGPTHLGSGTYRLEATWATPA